MLVGTLPAAAQAGLRADYKQMFSTPAPGLSAGTDTRILYKNPSDPNGKPIPVRREIFTFPEGTTFDGSAVPICHASDQELQAEGTAACPHASWVGGGRDDTSMSGFPGAGETPLDVDGFNVGNGLKVLGAPKQFPLLRSVAHIRWSGRVNTVDVPRSPGGPPDGESALRRVHNVFAARSRGWRAFVRTPGACPSSGAWTFRARFIFADGAAENDVYRMPCSRSLRGAPGSLIVGIRAHRKRPHRLIVVVRVRSRGRVRLLAIRHHRVRSRGSGRGRRIVIGLRHVPPGAFHLRVAARVGGRTQLITRRIRRARPRRHRS